MTVAPIPHGLTPRQLGARISWAKRREKYGQNGLTADGLRRLQASTRRNGLALRQERCHRGHKLSGDNVCVWRGGRKCKSCCRIWYGQRRQRRTHQAWASAEARRLKQAMLAAHPDRGGTSAAFVRARHAYERFRQQESRHVA